MKGVILVFFVVLAGLTCLSQQQAAAPLQQKPHRESVTENIAELMVTKSIQPEYPLAGQNGRPEGYVLTRVVVGADGKLADVMVVEGEPVLAKAATEAIRRWEFRPLRVQSVPPASFTFGFNSGDSVEAEFLATFYFDGETATLLSPIPVMPLGAFSLDRPMAGLRIHQVQPKYPHDISPLTGPARIMVEIHVDISGAAFDVKPLNGNPQFFTAAVEAAKQWRYVPGFISGEPVVTVHHALIEFRPPQLVHVSVP